MFSFAKNVKFNDAVHHPVLHLITRNDKSFILKIAEFANSIVLDEVAHNEPPLLDLHCLPSSL